MNKDTIARAFAYVKGTFVRIRIRRTGVWRSGGEPVTPAPALAVASRAELYYTGQAASELADQPTEGQPLTTYES